MKMANTRHRNEKLQTYRALALMWFLIGTSAMPVASSKAAVMGQMNVALSRRICMVIAMTLIHKRMLSIFIMEDYIIKLFFK